jgi:hypothetical protein
VRSYVASTRPAHATLLNITAAGARTTQPRTVLIRSCGVVGACAGRVHCGDWAPIHAALTSVHCSYRECVKEQEHSLSSARSSSCLGHPRHHHRQQPGSLCSSSSHCSSKCLSAPHVTFPAAA